MIEKVGTTIYLCPFINIESVNLQETFRGIMWCEYLIYLKGAANDQKNSTGEIRDEPSIYFKIGIARDH